MCDARFEYSDQLGTQTSRPARTLDFYSYVRFHCPHMWLFMCFGYEGN